MLMVCPTGCRFGGFVCRLVSGLGLLSLIPHLIERVPAVSWVGVGVAGWNTYRCGPMLSWSSTRCWVLRGHLLWVLFSAPFLACVV